MEFPEKIKKLRLDSRMTQPELANKLGVSIKIIQFYENGTNRPRKKRLQQIAELFGVSPEFLADDDADFPEDLTLDQYYIEEIREKYGDKAAVNLEQLFYSNAAFFAGGSMPQEDKDMFFTALMRTYIKSREAAIKKYGKVPDEDE